MRRNVIAALVLWAGAIISGRLLPYTSRQLMTNSF